MNKIEYGTEFLDQLKDSVHDLYDDNKELRDRISKAIEEIEKYFPSWCKDITPDELQKIKKILKGEDNE